MNTPTFSCSGNQDIAKCFLGLLDRAGPLLTESPFNLVDRERNRFQVQMETEIPGIGDVQGLSVFFLGKDGILALHCYDRADEFPKQLPTFNQIVDSFAFEPGYAYQPGPPLAMRVAQLVGCMIWLWVAGVLLFVVFKRTKATA